MIRWVQKRDGRIVPFHAEKIADAIFAAARAVGGEDRRQAEVLAGQVIHLLQQETLAGSVPQVEEIQDLVEKVLIEEGMHVLQRLLYYIGTVALVFGKQRAS